MTNFSPNIEFDESILGSEKSDAHIDNLKIASLNLDNYNQRLNENAKLIYKNFSFFKANNNNDEYIVNQINGFVYSFRNESIEKLSQIQIGNIENLYRETADIINNKIGLNLTVTQSDIDFFEHKREYFIKMYKDYYPLGLGINRLNADKIQFAFLKREEDLKNISLEYRN